MFMDKTKSKLAIVQVRKTRLFDATQITETIYDKRIKERVSFESIAVYPGSPRAEATWRHYQLKLDVDGRDPDVEYYTEEQYKACWKPGSMCDIEDVYLLEDRFKDFLIYEQNHYGHRPRKIKNPMNRYMQKNLSNEKKFTYFPKMRELQKTEWAKKRKAILEANNTEYKGD